jgi:hypothetical protein
MIFNKYKDLLRYPATAYAAFPDHGGHHVDTNLAHRPHVGNKFMGKKTGVLLTKRVVDAATPGPARFDMWDTNLAGFGLRVEASGTKTFIVRYRADGGGRTAPRRFATVGRFGPLTVDEARKQARIILGAAATGEDPAGERQARRREMTMRALVDLYETEGCFVQRGLRQGEPMKARTKAYTVSRLRHHVVPLLGHKRVKDVGPGEIERFVRDVGAGTLRASASSFAAATAPHAKSCAICRPFSALPPGAGWFPTIRAIWRRCARRIIDGRGS